MRFIMGFLIAFVMATSTLFILTVVAPEPDPNAPSQTTVAATPAATTPTENAQATETEEVAAEAEETEIAAVAPSAAPTTPAATPEPTTPAISSSESGPVMGTTAPGLSLAPEAGSSGAIQAPTASQPVQAPVASIEVPTPTGSPVTTTPASTEAGAEEVQEPAAEAQSPTQEAEQPTELAEEEVAEEEVPQAQEETPEVTEDVATEDEPATQVAEATPSQRLPTIGGSQGSSNLIDRRKDEDDGDQQAAPVIPELSTPFEEYATEAEASLLPKIGIILEPEGELDMDMSQVSLPVSILVPGTDENAKQLYEAARANGLEVFVSLRPESPLAFSNPDTADVSIRAAFTELPEAIGYAQDPILEVDRATKNAALEALTELGRGYLEFSSGLISGALGGRDDLPSGVIELGVTGDVTPDSIARALDRASLLAAQSGTTVLILPLKKDSIEALEAFAASQKGQGTALMPVSRIISP